MTSQACPCCGQALPIHGGLIVDPSGIITRGGRFAVFKRAEFSMFAALHAVSPRLRSRQQLLQDLYWDRPEEPDIKIVDVFVCGLRKKLTPLGLTIQTVWGQGYRLVIEPQASGETA